MKEIVLDFFEFDDQQREEESNISYCDASDEDEGSNNKAFWETHQKLLQEALSRSSSIERRIQTRMEQAMQNVESVDPVCTCFKECRQNCVLRNITDQLREMGCNSAVCKSKWRKSLNILSGEHRYIDVLIESKKNEKKKIPTRVIIELNFKTEFTMARTNLDYDRLLSHLPEIFVGKSERLRSVIKIMCAAAKKCMKDNKMHLAPWRKHKYMESKWLGTYERIMNISPLTLMLTPASVTDINRPVRASLLTFDLHCTVVEVV